MTYQNSQGRGLGKPYLVECSYHKVFWSLIGVLNTPHFLQGKYFWQLLLNNRE